MDLSRRQFIQTAAVGAAVAPSLGAAAAAGKLPSRPFGKTGMEVSILGFGSGSASWIWLLKKEYICETLDERDDWKLALSTLWIRHWQRFLESELVPEPEIYQHHYLCCELSKKKLSVRYLVLTTHNIYNVRTKIVKDKIELADTNVHTHALTHIRTYKPNRSLMHMCVAFVIAFSGCCRSKTLVAPPPIQRPTTAS